MDNRKPWRSQPQIAVKVRPDLKPIGGLLPAHGPRDTSGSALTIGTGISFALVDGAPSIESTLTNTGLGRAVQISDHPFTFVWRGRIDDAGQLQQLGSIASTADKLVRVYVQGSDVSAQHLGATTNAAAQVTGIWSAGSVATIVGVFASPTDVRIYASGNAATKTAQTTTNVGALGALTKLSFCRYDGSVGINPLDGSTQMAQWLRIAATESQAWSLVRNPWQIYQPLKGRQKRFGVSAGGGSQVIAVPAGTLVLTGFAPTITATANQTVAVPLGTLALSGQAPTVVSGDSQVIAVPAGTLTLTGFVPTVTAADNQTVAVPLETLTLTGQAPTVTATANQTIEVPAGTLSLTGQTPTAVASANQVVEVPLGTLALTGFAPAIVASGANAIQVPVGTLALAGFAPAVAVSENQTVAVPAGALTLAGFAPTVPTANIITVPLGTLALTGFAPTVPVLGSNTITVPLGTLIMAGRVPTVRSEAVFVSLDSVSLASNITTSVYLPSRINQHVSLSSHLPS